MTDKVPAEVAERVAAFEEEIEARVREIAARKAAGVEARRAAIAEEKMAHCQHIAGLNSEVARFV